MGGGPRLIKESSTTKIYDLKQKHFLTLCRLVQYSELDQLTTRSANEMLSVALGAGSGSDALVITMVTLSFLVRVCLIWLFFFLLSVAERTYKQVTERSPDKRLSVVKTLRSRPSSLIFRGCCLPNCSVTSLQPAEPGSLRFPISDWRKFRTSRCGCRYAPTSRYVWTNKVSVLIQLALISLTCWQRTTDVEFSVFTEFAETGSSAFSGCHCLIGLPSYFVSGLHLLCPGNI